MNTNEKSRIRNKLDICFPPPLYYSLHVAISTSIICVNNENYEWFYSNFIQVSFCAEEEIIKGGHRYCIFPSVDMRPGQFAASKFLVEKHLDLNVVNLKLPNLFDNIKLFIDSGYYVSCLVDVSKLKGTRYENVKYMKHGILIYGYDFENNTFDILDFDNRKAINQISISMDDFMNSYQSEELLSDFKELFNNTLILFERKNNNFSFDISIVREALQDYLNSYNSSIRYSLILPCNDHYIWGISTYKGIMDYITKMVNQNKKLDMRLFHAFYEHKKIMFDRFVFLGTNDFLIMSDSILDELKMNEVYANSLKMMAIKYNLTFNPQIAESMIRKLDEIKGREERIYTQIIDILSTVVNS